VSKHRRETIMKRAIPTACFALILVVALAQGTVRAHCDTLDGPVVDAARKALETGRIEPVLAWVKSADEAEIRSAFALSRRVRPLGPEARALADRSFFETVVRVHRAGEGAPYTGLKPAGMDQSAAIPAADKAIASGSTDALEKLLVGALRAGLVERFKAIKGRPAPGENVLEGREWVEAYVAFVHYVEEVYSASKGSGHGTGEPGTGGESGDAHRGHAGGEGTK
jgi:hypothetical protein